MTSRLAIIIVSYNARVDLQRCLASLAEAPPETSHEIVVVDNGSIDGSQDAVRAAGVRLIENGANLGFSRANNIGIRATASELVLLLNSDTAVPRGALDGLVAELDSHPGAAAVGPRLVDQDGEVELSFGPMMGPLNEIWQKQLQRGHERGRWPWRRMVRQRARQAGPRDWVSGACLLVRRADAEAVGLLDERFFLYTEDVDFCASLRARHREVRYTPAVTLVHLRGRSRAAAPAAAAALYRRSHLAFYGKHHPRWVPLIRLYLRLRGQLPPDAPAVLI